MQICISKFEIASVRCGDTGSYQTRHQTTVSVSRLTEWDHLTFIFIFRHLDSFSYNFSIKLFVSVVPPTIGQEILNMGLLILPSVLTRRWCWWQTEGTRSMNIFRMTDHPLVNSSSQHPASSPSQPQCWNKRNPVKIPRRYKYFPFFCFIARWYQRGRPKPKLYYAITQTSYNSFFSVEMVSSLASLEPST